MSRYVATAYLTAVLYWTACKTVCVNGTFSVRDSTFTTFLQETNTNKLSKMDKMNAAYFMHARYATFQK
jgi:hypothetical protein